MTCVVRFLLVLVCLALPLAYSASASAASGMGCHGMTHMPAPTPMLAATPAHAAHAAQLTTHLSHQLSAEHTHTDCDCALRCGCLQHCAASGLMAQSSWATLTPPLPAFVVTAIAIDLPSTRISSLFRPPIATLS